MWTGANWSHDFRWRRVNWMQISRLRATVCPWLANGRQIQIFHNKLIKKFSRGGWTSGDVWTRIADTGKEWKGSRLGGRGPGRKRCSDDRYDGADKKKTLWIFKSTTTHRSVKDIFVENPIGIRYFAKRFSVANTMKSDSFLFPQSALTYVFELGIWLWICITRWFLYVCHRKFDNC